MAKAEILIVEDDGIIAMDIESRLKKLGYGVTGIMAYGEKVIEKVKENEPDMVLMDIVLKGDMDRIEAAEEIRTQFDIPVIFLIAFADKDRLERAKLTNPFGFILKPFQNKDLEVTIEMALYFAKADAERKQVEETLHKNEEVRTCLTSLRLYHDQGILQGSIIDITERKQAEEILQESEERFRSTFEQAAVGIVHVTPDGRFLMINQRFCNIIGYMQEEMLTKIFQEITHPDDLNAYLERVQQLLENKLQTFSMEKRYIRKNGSHVWVNLTVSLVREPSGEPKYFIGVIEDIENRKQVEEELKVLG